MARSEYRTYPVAVRDVQRLTPHFLRVTFTGPELERLGSGGPDQRIKLVLPIPGIPLDRFPSGSDWYDRWRLLPGEARHPIRTYTIRRADPAARELVVDFVAHGDEGPASRWVQSAAPGDEVLVIAPDGVPLGGWEWHPGAATTLLLAGDETAVPAITAILESLPAEAAGAAFLEIPDPADAIELLAPRGMAVEWLPRAVADGGVVLDRAVRSWAAAWLGRPGEGGSGDDALLNPGSEVLWEVPAGPDTPGLYAWLAGEAGAITGLSRHLVRELGVERSRVAFMGYWKQGRAEN